MVSRSSISPTFLLGFFLWLGGASPPLAAQEQEVTSREREGLGRTEWTSTRDPAEESDADHRRGVRGVLSSIGKFEKPGHGVLGFRPVIAGLGPGSGFGGGVQFDQLGLMGGQLDLSASAIYSTGNYKRYDVKVDLPHLASDHVFLSVYARYRDRPKEDFSGIGPDSPESLRSDFRYEDSLFQVTAGLQPTRSLSFGGRVGLLKVSLSPGHDGALPDTEQQFDEGSAPGLLRQPDFLRSEVFAELDLRDSRSRPRSGIRYQASFGIFQDRDLDTYSFQRAAFNLENFIPLSGNKKHVVAIRLQGGLSSAKEGHRIPFYFLETLGGSRDLRAYSEYRFHDRGRLVVNAEYRWEVFDHVELALFGDAGQVFDDELKLSSLKADGGVGLRLFANGRWMLRTDFAYGEEGSRVGIALRRLF